jgi:hypothetical protein
LTALAWIAFLQAYPRMSMLVVNPKNGGSSDRGALSRQVG